MPSGPQARAGAVRGRSNAGVFAEDGHYNRLIRSTASSSRSSGVVSEIRK